MLKIVAALLMLVDHMGMVFFGDQFFLRLIGRLAMPLFAFGIARGFCKTRSVKKYMLRMGIFAVLSQIPFWMMLYVSDPNGFSWMQFNIGFTFLGALIALYLYEKIKKANFVYKLLYTSGMILIMILAVVLKCDYGAYGILVVIVFYEFYIKKKEIVKTFMMLLAVTALFLAMGRVYEFEVQLFALFSLFIIAAIKDKPTPSLKYFFYIFYPLHMFILSIIKIL